MEPHKVSSQVQQAPTILVLFLLLSPHPLLLQLSEALVAHTPAPVLEQRENH